MMARKYSKEFLEAGARLKAIPAEQRKKNSIKGGSASKGVPKTVWIYCDKCHKKATCSYFEAGARCAVQVQLKKTIMRSPETAFIELGFDNPTRFFQVLSKDILRLKDVIEERGESPSQMMGYIDRMISLAKLIYGEKHLNINVNTNDSSKVLDIERLLLEERKRLNYNPKTGEMGEVVDAEFEVNDGQL